MTPSCASGYEFVCDGFHGGPLLGTRASNWVKVKRKNAIPAQRFKRGPKSADLSIGL
jgi:hypothetical protein